MPVDVEPHEFDPAPKTILDRVFRRPGFCRACYLAPCQHPGRFWTEARPIGDRERRSPHSFSERAA